MKKALMVAAMLSVFLLAATASAAPSKPPKSPTPPFVTAPAAPNPGPVVHHGLSITLKLDPTVRDGQTATWLLTIKKTGGDTAKYVTAAIGWSYDGHPGQWMAQLSDLQPMPVSFLDRSRHWFRVGDLGNGASWQIGGLVQVPDRKDVKGSQPSFFCLQAAVHSAGPGQVGWMEYSQVACAQYSVWG